MRRATRLLVHGTGALLIVALIAAPVWDSWRYRGMRSSFSPRIPMAIIFSPSRGRTPALASIAGGAAGGPSETVRDGVWYRPSSSLTGRRIGGQPAALPGSRPFADTAVASQDAAAPQSDAGGGPARDAQAVSTSVVSGAQRPKQPAKSGRGAPGAHDAASSEPPQTQPRKGPGDGSPGDPGTAVLVGVPPMQADARNVAPTPLPPVPPPTRAPSLPSTPGDPTIAALLDPEVSLLASTSTLAVGDSVTVTIHVNGGDHVTSLPFHLMFDPAVLEFSDGVVDPSLGSRLQPVLLASVSPNRPGDLAVGLSFIESAGSFVGNGNVVVLHFRAIGSGDTNLEFNRASLRGATSEPLPAAFHNTSLTVR